MGGLEGDNELHQLHGLGAHQIHGRATAAGRHLSFSPSPDFASLQQEWEAKCQGGGISGGEGHPILIRKKEETFALVDLAADRWEGSDFAGSKMGPPLVSGGRSA